MVLEDATRLRLHDKTVVASISGGKDSAALSLWLTEQDIPHQRVFFDTGWEHEITYHFVMREPELRAALVPICAAAGLDVDAMYADLCAKHGPPGQLQDAIGEVAILKPRESMEELCMRKGMMPSRQRRFCTEEEKFNVIKDYIDGLFAAGLEPINCVGIRAEESLDRSTMMEWEFSDPADDGLDCWVWRPLIGFVFQDVVDIHQRHGLRPNPLYLMGATRVGCWPCIMANKGEIRRIAEMDPKRINRLAQLEEKVEIAAQARYDERVARYAAGGMAAVNKRERKFMFGPDKVTPKPFSAPAWFQSPTTKKEERECDKCIGEGFYKGETCPKCKGEGIRIVRAGKCLPIREVVKWAKTSRGGKEYEMFGEMPDTGCMRLGLCESMPKED